MANSVIQLFCVQYDCHKKLIPDVITLHLSLHLVGGISSTYLPARKSSFFYTVVFDANSQSVHTFL